MEDLPELATPRLADLPDGCLELVFTLLPGRSAAALLQTCRHLRRTLAAPASIAAWMERCHGGGVAVLRCCRRRKPSVGAHLLGMGVAPTVQHLCEAAESGCEQILEQLLRAAAPGVAAGALDPIGETPLHRAAECGHAECVARLLAAPGVSVDSQDADGRAPLHAAAEAGRRECVALLLAAPGVAVHARDSEGRTPLRLAAEAGHAECAQLLRG